MFRGKILPKVARFFIRFLSRTLCWSIYNENIIEDIKKKGQNVIFCFWHGRQFLLVYSHRDRNICIMTSLSRDGDLQTEILRRFGYKLIRGSSTDGGARALVEMRREIEKGFDVAFTVDGPKGPIYKVKPGPIFLAMHTNRPLIPVAVSAKKSWHIKNTWDNYMLPKPFTKVAVMYGSPMEITKQDNIEQKVKELENNLHKLTKELDEKIKVE